ncbi:TerB family tellurite resistance protein [Aestuariicoccus sp. MJ-SS9]|uniref:tellurite resistance TerB family protein n=1 Tax=Aestuariicoccus sp. MJ-SS9 TaxID=3079855 RepID=UPI00290E4A07|nr:TerB family tellurite resistance protein [Aestuariicoccus sp. MJ-SS9]MDU8910229.1 TerB family tellurite resistance protein [Aestuariicoccus sp. MJ-SS9]
MFERLKSFFHRKAPPATPLPEPDARLALGTILVRVALVDDSYLFEEVKQIDRILAAAYDLTPLEAAKMRATCERLAFELPKQADLAAKVREGVSYEHRLEKADALWRVALADGIADARETELVELIETQLGITPEDQETARRAAMGQ